MSAHDDPTVSPDESPSEVTRTLPVAAGPTEPAEPTEPPVPASPMPGGHDGSHGPSRARRLAPFAIAAAIASGVGIALVASVLDDDPITSSGSTPVAVTGTPSTVARPTAPPPTEANVPGLAGLLALLRKDPDAFGPRGDDLLDRLEDIAGRGRLNPDERAALLADVREWTRDGDLDPSVAAVVSRFLTTAPTVLGDGTGRGSDDGDRSGRDDDDDG